jgi:hypothetical protein
MATQKQILADFLELVNVYPSPHNGQPMRLRQRSEHTFAVYFERQRGLQATDISYIFSFVSMGIFIEHMSLCARALGHRFTYDLELPAEAGLHGEGPVLFAVCRIEWNTRPVDMQLKQALLFRQTSRKKYTEGAGNALAEDIITIASAGHTALTRLTPDKAKEAIWLNQRAVFDDMFDEPVRQELDHWLRYTQQQKQLSKDGLAYDCMELNGKLMKYIVNHPGILRLPGVSRLLRSYYLRTMTDNSDVFYMQAPFATPVQAFNVGVTIMKVWRSIAESGRYIHPFGTIMSNAQAHSDFVKLAGVVNETHENAYLVFIFRCGKSEAPVRSLRIPYQEHLVME